MTSRDGIKHGILHRATITYKGRDGLYLDIPCLKLRHGTRQSFKYFVFGFYVQSKQVCQQLKLIEARLQELAFEQRSHFDNANNEHNVSRISVLGRMFEDLHTLMPHLPYHGTISGKMHFSRALPSWMPKEVNCSSFRFSRCMKKVVLHLSTVRCNPDDGFSTLRSVCDMEPVEEEKQ